jgi:hypothetical protein
MSKKRRMKMQKIQNDESLNEVEKEALNSQLEENCNKRQKRGDETDFKDKKSYVEFERKSTSD